MSLVAASLLLVVALAATGCISMEFAQRSIDFRVLLAIGASLALGLPCKKRVLRILGSGHHAAGRWQPLCQS